MNEVELEELLAGAEKETAERDRLVDRKLAGTEQGFERRRLDKLQAVAAGAAAAGNKRLGKRRGLEARGMPDFLGERVQDRFIRGRLQRRKFERVAHPIASREPDAVAVLERFDEGVAFNDVAAGEPGRDL